jgi:GAF domain-containing protein
MYELSRVLAEPRGFRGTGDLVLKHLRRLVAFNQAAVFVYEVAADDMVARHGMGDISDAIVGLRMPLGHRLSGWVAANRSMIVNSDPALDLGEIATTEGLKLRSCMSAPLVSDGQLVGVLTLYSEIPDGFTEDDRRILEAVVAQTSDAFRRAVGVDDPDPRLEPASVRVRTSAEGAALPSAARG